MTEGNVVPFKNIGHFAEQLVEFAGKHKGLLSIRAEGPDEWYATLSFPEQNKSLEKQGDTFHNAVLSLYRAATQRFGGAA